MLNEKVGIEVGVFHTEADRNLKSIVSRGAVHDDLGSEGRLVAGCRQSVQVGK